MVDLYTRYAASVLAAAAFLRSLAGFSFPLFAPYMFGKSSYGLGNSDLAIVAFVPIGIGIHAPILLGGEVFLVQPVTISVYYLAPTLKQSDPGAKAIL
jgi:hypothetical protein